MTTLSLGLIVTQAFTPQMTEAQANKNDSFVVANVMDEHDHEHGGFDVRTDDPKVLPMESQLEAAKQLSSTVGTGLQISWNHTFGTPAMITKDKGYLTDSAEGEPEDIARNWLKEHAQLFGLNETDINQLQVRRNYEMPGTGLNPITFQQTFDGIASVFGGRINVAVNEDGKILSVASNARPSGKLEADFSLTESEALLRVLDMELPGIDYEPEHLGTQHGWEEFAGGDVLPTEQRVKKAVFLTHDSVRPAYRVLLIEELNVGHEIVIDGVTGERLYERSLVDDVNEAQGLIFENYPGAPAGGEQVLRPFVGDPEASPEGWVFPTSETGVTTFGNNANAYANWSNFLVPEGGVVRPLDPLGQFNYPFTNAWQEAEGEVVPPSYAEDVNSAIANLFYHHNLFHDHTYKLGWVEPAGNLQVSNFGKGGNEGDPIFGMAQAGASTGGDPLYTGRNNAYMLTLPDGFPSWSGMFLWEPIPGAFNGPYVDGDYDASVIYHEYAHALTNRLVAGGESLSGHQAGAMGEGWGDWYGMSYLISNGLETDPVVGKYVTGNHERGIRNYALSDAPYNYGDVGYDLTGPQVHADGGIWAAILWHVRDALVAEYGEQEGAHIAEQLVTDAMPISVPSPSMVDMRTAIITADVERYDAAHHDLLWTTFAQRGLGADAHALGANDTNPTPGFNHPDEERNGTLVGQVIHSGTKEPIADANIIVGQYEARTTPTAVSGENGGFSIPMVEGTYDITIQAKGFGSRTIKDVSIDAGEANAYDIVLQPNLASSAIGASISSVTSEQSSNPATFAIDDTAGSVYASAVNENGFEGAEFVIELAGDKTRRISHVQINAFTDVGGARFATLKDFEVQVSSDGSEWTTVIADTFDAADPRPTSADLNYRGWDLDKPEKAKYVKLIAKNTHADSTGYVQVADVQVFSDQKVKLEPISIEAEPSFETTGHVLAGNPGNGLGYWLIGSDVSLGVTENEFTSTQNPEPASQGTDGYVVEIPQAHAQGLSTATVVGDSDGAYDFDLYFYDEHYNLISGVGTSAADESGAVPAGTRYIYVALWSGEDVTFTLSVDSAF
nr:M36 family metallopeptidase [Caldalkalibacillus salinus]